MTAVLAIGMVPQKVPAADSEDGTMEPTLMPQIELDERRDEHLLVHEWHTEQLQSIDLATLLAERFAGVIDWHEVAALAERGCSPELALEIVR
jgi:hypothetical protein